MSSLSHECGSERYEACSNEATADTTAELGCSWLQVVTDCLCHVIRPAADRGSAVPALPGPCSHHGAQVGSVPNSLDGLAAVPSNGFHIVL